jgi:hypothetical protein
MVVFDFLTGELKFINNTSNNGGNSPTENEFIDFGNRTGDYGESDIALDTGERLNENSIIDLKFRI